MLVDLPGYGYARAAKHEIKRWNQLIQDYLKGRPNLRRVCLLLDARHGIKEADLHVMALLDEAAVSYQAVLTKIDKLKPAERGRTLADLEAALRGHPAAHPVIVTTSSASGDGVAEFRAALAALASEG
jgi:GTP-binding protein